MKRIFLLSMGVPNPEYKLKPDMWANVTMNIALERKLVVPEDAVMDTGTMQMVFLDLGQGFFEPRHPGRFKGARVLRSLIRFESRGEGGHLSELPHRLGE